MNVSGRTPHIAFPFRFGADGSVEVVGQDTREEVEQNVLVLLLTERGERVEVPDFGIRDLVFQTELDLEAITQAASEWDERVEVRVEEDRFRGMIRNVRLELGEA